MNKNKRVAMITGAAGGIGRATVSHFSKKGWKVIGVDLFECAGVFPEDGLFISADFSKATEIESVFIKANNFSEKLDAVINNAALQITKPLIETSMEEWDLVLATNLKAAFACAKYGNPLLKRNGGGAIVNVSSVHALATSMNIAAYAASKGGLLSLTRAMAIEFAPDHIRVNALLPGAVDTKMLRDGLKRGHVTGNTLDSRLNDLARKTVLGRIGKPEEIARAIYFLADEEQSSFITGQALVVDGGATARLSTE